MNTAGVLMMVVFLAARVCLGAEVWVAPDGDDANLGTKLKPWKTWQHAADQARPGTTVNIRGGTYCQRLSIQGSGNAGKGWITFRSLPGEKAVLDGGCLTVAEGGSRAGSALVSLTNV